MNEVSNKLKYAATLKLKMKEAKEFRDDDSFIRIGKFQVDEAADKFEVTYEFDEFYIICKLDCTPK